MSTKVSITELFCVVGARKSVTMNIDWTLDSSSCLPFFRSLIGTNSSSFSLTKGSSVTHEIHSSSLYRKNIHIKNISIPQIRCQEFKTLKKLPKSNENPTNNNKTLNSIMEIYAFENQQVSLETTLLHKAANYCFDGNIRKRHPEWINFLATRRFTSCVHIFRRVVEVSKSIEKLVSGASQCWVGMLSFFRFSSVSFCTSCADVYFFNWMSRKKLWDRIGVYRLARGKCDHLKRFHFLNSLNSNVLLH